MSLQPYVLFGVHFGHNNYFDLGELLDDYLVRLYLSIVASSDLSYFGLPSAVSVFVVPPLRLYAI